METEKQELTAEQQAEANELAEQEAAEAAKKQAEKEDLNPDDDLENDDLDDDGNPIEKKVEPWMEEDSADDQTSDDDPSKSVPVGKYVSLKKNLRGQLVEKDDELEKLKAENEALRAGKTIKKETKLVRPNIDDFYDDDDYHDALDKYHDDRAGETYQRNQQLSQQNAEVQKAIKDRDDSVDEHYVRVNGLLKESGIAPAIYKTAEIEMRKSIAAVIPKGKDADIIFDQFIHLLGEGSEKVSFFIGRNVNARNKFQSLLAADHTGLRAAIYLGQEKQRLTNPTKLKSQASKPAPNAKGDTGTETGTALQRKYNKASDGQAAFDIKRKAKLSGVDTSNW